MKIAFGLILLAVIGWLVVYQFGGYGSFDPTEQGRKAKAAIAPGMAYGQVFDLAGDPTRYRIINRKVVRENGVEIERFVPSPEVNTDRARIKARVDEHSLEHGFVCTWRYSNQMAFTVYFDGAGAVTEVADAVTMADLLDARQP